MSTISSNPNKTHKSTSHRRNDSGELDVFEAARYFSTAGDHIPGGERHRPARRSLDMPMRPHILPPEYHHMMIMGHEKPIKDSKKYKQPSSPGGRLASFLNSLFNQTHLKKKKKKSKSKEFDDESPGGRRKRRSSISHFMITSSNTTNIAAPDHKKTIFSSFGSGFRTPPPYADTPTKLEFRKFSENIPAISPTRNGRNFKITLLDKLHAERNDGDYAWMEEKFRISNGVSEKLMKNGDFVFSNKNSEEREICRKMIREEDDGADSDSSSDLFDLPNHDLDFFSNGLPVYGTTHMDRIKIVPPISSATTI